MFCPLNAVQVMLLFSLLSVWQTFLEQTKTKFSKNYKGMSLSKITTTVGLNSKGLPK